MEESIDSRWTPKMILGWISVFLIFFGIFAKDIVSFYFLDYSLRNHYGAACVLAGGAIAGILVLSRYRLRVLQLASNKLIVSWAVLLLLVSPLTAYAFNGRVFVSPHAVGFCAALACYLVSRHVTKKVLILVLIAQFIALLYEYHLGVSLTLTANEAQNVFFGEGWWLIDPAIGLIRAKGMLDSTHDSTWLFFYSALIFELGIIIMIFSFCAGWMAQGRLAMMAVGILCLVSKDRVRILAILAVVGLLATAIYPGKMIGGVQFFLTAFDPESSSNRVRVEATGAAVEYFKGNEAKVDEAKVDDVKVDDVNGAEVSGADVEAADVPANDADVETADVRAKDAQDSDAGANDIRDNDIIGDDVSASDVNETEVSRADVETADVRDKDVQDGDAGANDIRDNDIIGDDVSASDVKDQEAVRGLAFFLRTIFGASSSSLGSGTVLTEMGYTLFAIEYGILGIVLMAWTTAVVFLRGRAARNRSCIALSAFIPILMFSSGTQSASSFFMLWLAILFLTRIVDIKHHDVRIRPGINRDHQRE